ncbi:MAG TPA: YceI family protein [Saprospiraceae bacterium]|nr:YceI family protein [Saprospiraceae bacterium]HMQ81262.1 YceI family protein [Saprospiraceae bacterium]
MKQSLVFMLALLSVSAIHAQKYFTKAGNIAFFSDTALEKIEAHNYKATSVIDLTSGQMEFAVLIKAFQFEKALMQEHFNENYMESDKFPKATFKGEIQNLSDINFKKDGDYTAKIKGKLTIHGVTKDIETTGTFNVKSGKISASSVFNVLVADYGIKIPTVVKDNVAKEVKIEVNIDYEELKG